MRPLFASIPIADFKVSRPSPLVIPTGAQRKGPAVRRLFLGNVFRQRNHWPSAKVMKNGFWSAITVDGGTTLPFVISTGAQRSGEICGPFLEMCFRQSEAQRRDLQFLPQQQLSK
jgi:hypothetical protein